MYWYWTAAILAVIGAVLFGKGVIDGQESEAWDAFGWLVIGGLLMVVGGLVAIVRWWLG